MNAIDNGLGRLNITGVTCDSRRVEPGFLFAALPGSVVDGRAYIDEAVKKGAAAILVPDDSVEIDVAVPIIRDSDPRRRYAQMAAAHYIHQPANIGAVTGTNGKTSVAWFARQLINSVGMSSASAGTLGITANDAKGQVIVDNRGSLTTPDPSDLHHDLADLAAKGVTHLVLEASSHGLDQRRLDGVRVRAAAFTNLSRDHLDYHKTEAAYLAAKVRLFDTLVIDGGSCVVNTDATYAEAFISAAQVRSLEIVRVGRRDNCAIRIRDVRAVPGGLQVAFDLNGEPHHYEVPLIGTFQAENALVALGLAGALGVDTAAAAKGLSTLNAAPGRMQFCGTVSGAGAFVDYAHTPDALRTVLSAIRPHATNRVIVVFGCGGDRDPGKRPEMAKAAADGSDIAILTDDNPRSEDPATIRAQAKAGAPDAIEIGDRRTAIREAVSKLQAGDVLVVAGKGHEQGQIVGRQVLPFDDADEVRAAIAEVGG